MLYERFIPIILIECCAYYRFMLGRYKHALDALRRAELLLTRPDAEVFYLIGDLFLRRADRNDFQLEADAKKSERLANWSEAKLNFEKAIELDGRRVDSFKKLSSIYVRERHLSKAIEMLEACVL